MRVGAVVSPAVTGNAVCVGGMHISAACIPAVTVSMLEVTASKILQSLSSRSIERWCLVFLSQAVELSGQCTADRLVVLFRVDALHFIRVFYQIIEVPFITFGKVDQFVGVGPDTKVLWNRMFAEFVVGVVQRVSPSLRPLFEQW